MREVDHLFCEGILRFDENTEQSGNNPKRIREKIRKPDIYG